MTGQGQKRHEVGPVTHEGKKKRRKAKAGVEEANTIAILQHRIEFDKEKLEPGQEPYKDKAAESLTLEQLKEALDWHIASEKTYPMKAPSTLKDDELAKYRQESWDNMQRSFFIALSLIRNHKIMHNGNPNTEAAGLRADVHEELMDFNNF